MNTNHVEKIAPETFELLKKLLTEGKITKDNFEIDGTAVQNISLGNGFARFDPPLQVSGKFGFLKIRTTITEIGYESKADAIIADIDASPINIEVRPNA